MSKRPIQIYLDAADRALLDELTVRHELLGELRFLRTLSAFGVNWVEEREARHSRCHLRPSVTSVVSFC